MGLDGTAIPVRTHVYTALKSGDLSLDEIEELVLQLALHAGWPTADHLRQVALENWTQIEAEGGLRTPRVGPEQRLRSGGSAARGMISGGAKGDRVELEDKVVVITGSGSGIGEACARRFAAEGAKVVVTDIDAAGVARGHRARSDRSAWQPT